MGDQHNPDRPTYERGSPSTLTSTPSVGRAAVGGTPRIEAVLSLGPDQVVYLRKLLTAVLILDDGGSNSTVALAILRNLNNATA